MARPPAPALLATACGLVALSVVLVLPAWAAAPLLAAAVVVAWHRRLHIARYLVAHRAELRRHASDIRAAELRVQAARANSRRQDARQAQLERSRKKTQALNVWHREFYGIGTEWPK